jgi:hypothetical protein
LSFLSASLVSRKYPSIVDWELATSWVEIFRLKADPCYISIRCRRQLRAFHDLLCQVGSHSRLILFQMRLAFRRSCVGEVIRIRLSRQQPDGYLEGEDSLAKPFQFALRYSY